MNDKIKVCFVMPKAYCLFDETIDGVFGGAEVDFYYLSTALAKDAGFDVSFVVGDYGQEAERQIEGVRVIKSLKLKGNSLAGAIKIWRAMRKIGADIYVAETASPGVPLIAGFCKMHNCRFVYRFAHKKEFDGEYAERHSFLSKLFGWSLKSASAVIAQNDDDVEEINRVFGVNCSAIRNAHRLPEMSGQDRDTILWVGRSARFKHPERFIELARRFGDEKFVMICQRATGDDDYDSLKKAAGEVENLEFVERVGFGEIDEYFRRAKIFVNTSDSEGFPNTFIQAAKAGAAIVSYKVNPDNFLGEYNCGVDCMGDMDKAAKAVRFLLDDDRYVETGLNGRKYAEANHDISVLIEDYKGIFREIIGGGAGAKVGRQG